MSTVFSSPRVSHARLRQIRVFETDLGWMGIAHTESALHRVEFGYSSRGQLLRSLHNRTGLLDTCDAGSQYPGAWEIGFDADSSLPFATDLVRRLQDYARGVKDDFADIQIFTSHLRQFGRRVIEACRRIPYGQTCSYGELAARCLAPRAARAVGQLMARNRYPLIVPCHRVLGSGGRLGGYSAPGGLQTKKTLLQLESDETV